MHSQARAAPPYTPQAIHPAPRIAQAPDPSQRLWRFASGTWDGQLFVSGQTPLQIILGSGQIQVVAFVGRGNSVEDVVLVGSSVLVIEAVFVANVVVEQLVFGGV